MNHKLYSKGDLAIPQSILDGNGDVALDMCKVCFGAESSLPTYCPSVKMTLKQEEDVAIGTLDCTESGAWMRPAYSTPETSEDDILVGILALRLAWIRWDLDKFTSAVYSDSMTLGHAGKFKIFRENPVKFFCYLDFAHRRRLAKVLKEEFVNDIEYFTDFER